jgi:hypothetical protein
LHIHQRPIIAQFDNNDGNMKKTFADSGLNPANYPGVISQSETGVAPVTGWISV